MTRSAKYFQDDKCLVGIIKQQERTVWRPQLADELMSEKWNKYVYATAVSA